MKKLLKVAFNLPLYSTYDYLAPGENNGIKTGMRVETSFGRKKLIGIISEIKNIEITNNSKYKLKTIDRVLDLEPILTKEIIKLCKWSSDYYQYFLVFRHDNYKKKS